MHIISYPYTCSPCLTSVRFHAGQLSGAVCETLTGISAESGSHCAVQGELTQMKTSKNYHSRGGENEQYLMKAKSNDTSTKHITVKITH